MPQNRRLLGTALTFMACLGFSIVPALAKSSYNRGANALGVMTVRFSVAALLLLPNLCFAATRYHSDDALRAARECCGQNES